MDGIKGRKAQVEKISKAIQNIRATEAGGVAIGDYLRGNALDQFLVERSNVSLGGLGGYPVVITGSANFSEASCNKNDEKEVAAIYQGEFMRSYSHYAFRDAATIERGLQLGPGTLRKRIQESSTPTVFDTSHAVSDF